MKGIDTTGKVEDGVEHMRSQMNGLVRELDRGRHGLLDRPMRLPKNAWAIGIGVACVIGGVSVFAAWRKGRRSGLAARIEAFQHALSRMMSGAGW
jgi:hypothetical protein